MKLDEAKEILKKAGYLVRSLNEDTETNDDEYADAESREKEYNDKKHIFFKDRSGWENIRKNKKAYAEWKKALDDLNDLDGRHMDLADKIKAAKQFNKPTAIVSSFKEMIKWAKSNGWKAGFDKNADFPCICIEWDNSDENWTEISEEDGIFKVRGPWGYPAEFDTFEEAFDEVKDIASNY